MKDNELIVCRDVSLGYEGRSVLTGLNLTISKGDYLCVVGDNGSGKSTLMRGLLGLLQPQSEPQTAPCCRSEGGIVFSKPRKNLLSPQTEEVFIQCFMQAPPDRYRAGSTARAGRSDPHGRPAQ